MAPLIRILSYAAALHLLACGRADNPSTPSSNGERVDQIRKVPTFNPSANDLLTRFNNDAVQHGIIINSERLSGIKIRFSNGPITDAGPGTENAIGVCSWYDNSVSIRMPEFWPYEYPSTDRFYRVFAHEAGHCLLNLLHNGTDAIAEIDGRQIPVPGTSRIMAPSEAELNDQFNTSMWPALKSVFFQYARDVADNKVDGILDAEGLGVYGEEGHNGVTCALTH